MKIAVCEDEKVFADSLRKNIESIMSSCGEKTEISYFSDGIPLIESFEKGDRYDLVFLDIQLEKTDGMETAAKLRNYDSSFDIIFMTSIEDRAVEGYAVAAFDYIVKSSADKRLVSVLDRYMRKYRTEIVTLPLANGETRVLRTSDILWFESEGRGTSVGTGSDMISLNIPVGKVCAMMPQDRFTEVHKSVYVQTSQIRNIGTDTVEMSTGRTFPLSRRKRKDVMNAVMKNVRGDV